MSLVTVNPLGKLEGSVGYISELKVISGDGEEVTLIPDSNGNIDVDSETATELIKVKRFTFAGPSSGII